MRAATIGFALVLGCAPAEAQHTVRAQADAPYPGPCATVVDDGEATVETAYEYSPTAKLVRERQSNGQQRLWSYDERGRRSRQLIVDGRSLRAIWYRYDDHGMLVATEEDATGNGDIVLRRLRDYDDAGHLVRRAVTDADGAVLEEHALHYDARGRLDFEVIQAGESRTRVEIDLDPGGRIIARRSAAEDQRFVYALTGRLQAMVVERGGAPHITRRYAYDEAGNLLLATTYDRHGRSLAVTRHSYACWTSSPPSSSSPSPPPTIPEPT